MTAHYDKIMTPISADDLVKMSRRAVRELSTSTDYYKEGDYSALLKEVSKNMAKLESKGQVSVSPKLGPFFLDHPEVDMARKLNALPKLGSWRDSLYKLRIKFHLWRLNRQEARHAITEAKLSQKIIELKTKCHWGYTLKKKK